MKSMLDAAARQQFVERVNKITTETKPLWGIMTPDQVVHHLNRAMEYSLGDYAIPYTGNAMMHLMKPIILMLPIPRSKFETFAEMKATERYDLDAEKVKFAELMKRYERKAEMPVQPISPLLGKMNVNEWGKLDFGHTHHHLTQFGV